MWKFYEKENDTFLFISLFVNGAFYMQGYGDWRYSGRYHSLIILKHCKAHFDLYHKIDLLFFHEICTIWRVSALIHSVKVSNQEAVYLFIVFFLNVLWYHAQCLKIKVGRSQNEVGAGPITGGKLNFPPMKLHNSLKDLETTAKLCRSFANLVLRETDKGLSQ